ncbi:hypothetical protein MMC17_006807 [Xylographa soralifera]|nr:hypothetical protein [Xylographa soralifera]
MADYERTHDLPTGCNTVVYAFRDTNGNRVLEMGSVSVPVGSSRLKFHRPQKITIQRAIPPPPPALVQVTPEIMTAVTLPSKKKIPKKKKKKTTKREDQPSNDRASLEPCPASYENTEYHHTEREERHEIESRTNISNAELVDLSVPFNVNAALYSIALRVEAEDNARRAGSALQNHGIQESGDEAQDMEVEVEVQASNTSDQVNRRRYRGPRGRA